MRDYSKIERYLNILEKEIYPQPQDDGHSALAEESIKFFTSETGKINSVLDLGCGEGFCQEYFDGIEYTGVCLLRDYDVAVSNGRNVFDIDFSFLPFEDKSYDLLYSRHALEHSPMPLLTLMEWHRVCGKYLALVLPTPEYWGVSGKNHYFVLDNKQWENLFMVSGFSTLLYKVKEMDMTPKQTGKISPIEYWFLLERQ